MVKTFSPSSKPPLPPSGSSTISKILLTADNPVNVGSTNIKVTNPYNSDFKLVTVLPEPSLSPFVSITNISTNNSRFLVKVSSSGSFFLAAVPVSVSNSSFSLQEFKSVTDHSQAISITCNLASESSSNSPSPSTSSFRNSLKFVDKCLETTKSSNPLSTINKDSPAVSQDTNVTSQKPKVIQQILRSNETLSQTITSLATINKDHHFNNEFKALLAWLRSFNSSDHNSTLSSVDSYKTEFEASQTNLSLWQKNTSILPVSHFSYYKTKYTSQSEAYNFRFISKNTHETISPLNLNVCSTFSIIGDDFNSLTNIFRISSKFLWQRSSELSVSQSSNYVNQSSNSIYLCSTNLFVSTKTKTLQQSNSFKLQVDTNYDLIVGQINVDCKTNNTFRVEGQNFNESKGNSYHLAKNFFIESSEETSLKSKGDTQLYSQAALYISSERELAISSNSITKIDGSSIQIGMGAGARPIIDLDTNSILNPDPVKAAGIPTNSP